MLVYFVVAGAFGSSRGVFRFSFSFCLRGFYGFRCVLSFFFSVYVFRLGCDSIRGLGRVCGVE